MEEQIICPILSSLLSASTQVLVASKYCRSFEERMSLEEEKEEKETARQEGSLVISMMPHQVTRLKIRAV